MSRYGFIENAGMYAASTYESIVVNTTAATGLTTAVVPAGALRALITVDDGTFRYRYDGTSPTTTEGHQIQSGGVVGLVGKSNINNFEAIAVSGTATLRVTYEVDFRF